MEGAFIIMALFAGFVVLSASAFGFVILWEIWNIYRQKRRVRQLILNHEQASKARKAGPSAEGMVWDRELDG
jgi:hypothetical protein